MLRRVLLCFSVSVRNVDIKQVLCLLITNDTKTTRTFRDCLQEDVESFLLLKPRRLSRLKRVHTSHRIQNCRRVTSHHFSFHSAGGQFDDMKSICAQMVLLPAPSNPVLPGCSECSRSRQEDVCLPGNLLSHTFFAAVSTAETPLKGRFSD